MKAKQSLDYLIDSRAAFERDRGNNPVDGPTNKKTRI